MIAEINIRYAMTADIPFWLTLDRHIPQSELERKLRDRMAYIIELNGTPAGLLRYNLFWDSIPFCTMLYISPEHQRKGLGRVLMAHWEQEMKQLGHGMVMTSTQVDEQAQHFYRRLGYTDCGALVMNIPGYEQPMEMFMSKKM